MPRMGIRNSPEYRSWEAMKSRCYRTRDQDYKYYGAKGVTVCDRWIHNFEAFLEDMGPIPEDIYRSLERIDRTKSYSKDNCKWATTLEQNANRSNSILLTYNGETKTARQWALARNLNYCTLLGRIKRGWETEKALLCKPYRLE